MIVWTRLMPYRATLAAVLVIVGSLATTEPSAEQIDDDTRAFLIEFCKSTLCREPGTVVIETGDHEPYTETYDTPLPLVFDDQILIMPGDIVVVEGDIVDGKLTGMRLVMLKPTIGDQLIGSDRLPDVLNPERSIVFEFRQEGSQRVLTGRNGFPEILKFHAHMRFQNDDNWYNTSTCSLKATPLGLEYVVVELWQDPIVELALTDFHVIDPDSEEAGLCIY